MIWLVSLKLWDSFAGRSCVDSSPGDNPATLQQNVRFAKDTATSLQGTDLISPTEHLGAPILLMFDSVKRIYTALNPPKVDKEPNHLRFGILGAANIAPMALILVARSHPGADVIAVAARNEQKAKTFAKKYGIGKVYYGPTGYQELIMDPNIDAVYNPLPNGLHFEWTAKALAAGKHVLLEKPSTNRSEETRKLFKIANDNDVVLLEAFHYRFHPAFSRFMEIVESGELGKVKSVKSELAIPHGLMKDDDIRFNFDLGGGSLMDLGVYPISALRAIVREEPISILTATHIAHPRDPNVDRAAHATLIFPNNVTGEIACDLQMPWFFGIIPPWPKLRTTVQLEGGEVCLYNSPGAHLYHSITITPKVGERRLEKAYKPEQGKGEEWWTTYRYQLEAFVNKVKGHTPHTWITDVDSVNQMKAVEMIYEKLGLPLRSPSTFVVV